MVLIRGVATTFFLLSFFWKIHSLQIPSQTFSEKIHAPKLTVSSTENDANDSGSLHFNRRSFLGITGSLLLGLVPLKSKALFIASEEDLDELPDFSLKLVNQYAPTLQFNIDFYLFEFKEVAIDPSKWDQLLDTFRASNDARFASVSRMERDFYTPMRNLAQGFPEELGGDELIESTLSFEKSMKKLEELSKQTGAGVSDSVLQEASNSWENGRVALNSFIGTINSKQSKIQMAPIPQSAEDSTRSKARFINYKKTFAKCQQGGLGVNVCADIMNKYTAVPSK